MPDPTDGRPPNPQSSLGPTGRLLLRGGAAVAVLALVLLLLDIALGIRLPQPLRPALPFILAAGLALALAVGVGAYGTPQRPGPTPGDQRKDSPTPP
jgi:hypothetical protein